MPSVSQAGVVRRRISIRGIVQGVGFRPFTYNLAQSAGVRGFILNSSSGVIIEAEAPESVLQEFLAALRNHHPPLARIEEIAESELEPVGDLGFEIRESLRQHGDFALVSPDVAVCQDCMGDIVDPGNRRYGYPFTNCTNCGPRYTIIRDVPYDRPMTTMAGFRMCAECESEYHDPGNRRFHAQPNACPACGPTLALARSGSFLPPPSAYSLGNLSLSVVRKVRRLLHEGAIVAVKGLGGFQLACDAGNDAAVRRLRARKKRSDKPFALMTRDLAALKKICRLLADDCELLLSPEHPIVILPRRHGTALSSDIAPGNNTLGVMLAYTPLHYQLFGDGREMEPEFAALVMTSGNLSDEPIVTSNEEAWRRLAPVADWFLFHNRDIYMRVDDSVARTFAGSPCVLRRSRGYVPQTIDLHSPVRELLACGAELKNALCLTKDHYAIMSQHIGDLENYETLQFFQETLDNLKKLFRAEPQAVACDLHPLYLSSRFANDLPLPKIGVQHHHAHIASCMAENHLEGKVIGVAFDGTGYGTDGRIWGGEFLVADFAGFERRAHLRYVPLPGGDVSVRQPWRSALSWLQEAFGTQVPGDLQLCRQVPERGITLVRQMLMRGINTVLTSSCGRLFDAVASLLGLRQEVSFEGQAAIELEMAIQPGINDIYCFDISSDEPAQVDVRPAIRGIVRDLSNNVATGVVASRFHNTMAAVISEVCRRIRSFEHLGRVCLSGGTFQNMYLLEKTVAELRRSDFDVFLHSQVPPNDGGIALGQAVIANQILQSGA
jgi:hydrogenase maturation protein HypF